MTESTRCVINFDKVKDEYIASLGLSETPMSNDALFDDGKGCIVFVEFKNGFIDNTTIHNLGKKIYDSTIIYTDITSSTISAMRQNVIYILVYNEAENYNNSDPNLVKKMRRVPPSRAFMDFSERIASYALDEIICFKLKKFKNFCFKEVHTYTEAEFAYYLATL